MMKSKNLGETELKKNYCNWLAQVFIGSNLFISVVKNHPEVQVNVLD